MESKTIKHLKNMAALPICQTNSVLRLHYRSECDNIIDKSTESHMTKASKNLECKFCYATSPKLKVLCGSKKAQRSNKRKYKPVYLMCRVCKTKYPKEYTTKLETNREDNLNKKISRNVNLYQNRKSMPKDDVKDIEKKKPKKRRHKDVNAGLILSSTPLQNFKVVRKNNENKKEKSSIKNDKILQMLLKKSETSDGPQFSSGNKLEMFLKST